MAIKDLFRNEEASSALVGKSLRKLGEEVESENYIDAYVKNKDRSIPHVDLYVPENFAKYGSAEKYYKDSIRRIIHTYPYDGSGYEKTLWELSSSYLDLHIFKNEYPKTNGYINLACAGWGNKVETIGDYGAPATASYEYIHVSQSINVDNVFESATGQTFNIGLNGSGSTVEFWLKKEAYAGLALTSKEVIFDLWNGAPSSSVEYGRFTIEVSASTTADDSPFRVTYMSGTSGYSNQMIGSGFTTASLLDGWNHYAFSIVSGAVRNLLKFYVNGELNQTLNTFGGGGLTEIISTGSQMNIGGLLTAPSGNIYHTFGDDMKGWGKFSGSLDEFRFWKESRTSRDIGRNWFTQVDGGTNTDTSNTSLGIYFKFNEGITGKSTRDSKVLDYSGRVSNATWTGYVGDASRNVGSAIVSASAAEFETKDPIIYSDHPDVSSYYDEKVKVGQEYDYTNNASIIKSVPAWIIEEDEEEGTSELKHLTQIIASYFDMLHLQVEVLPSLSAIEYTSGSHVATSSFKPYPFVDRMLESRGFPAPELFADAEILEFFKDRDEDRLYRDTIHDIKNLIYKNIYNNLIYIYKSKGTEKSFRNLFHCFGVDEELLRINLYADNETYTFEDHYREVVEKKRYVNFYNTGSFNATVFQQTSSAISDSLSYISGSGLILREKDHAVTVEAECIFPRVAFPQDKNFFEVPVTCSLFGGHSKASGSADADMTWDTSDSGSFHVYAVRNSRYSRNARFYLSSSQNNFPTLSSSVFVNVFDNKRWNFAIRVKPSRTPQSLIGDSTYNGTSPSTYDVDFYGVHSILSNQSSSFHIHGTIDETPGTRFLSDRKRIFVGAHRTNFTGAVLQQSYAKISSVRYWLDYLDNETINFHARSPLNYGTRDPYRNAYLYEGLGGSPSGAGTYVLTGSHHPQVKTLALHWDFSNLTGSGDSSVEAFTVTDISSGSTTAQGDYGTIGKIALTHHPGVGYDFPTDHNGAIVVEHVQSAKKSLPEIMNSYDMVNIITGSAEETFGRDERPTTYFLSIEKSMYQNISEEMINMFSTIAAFSNLIGDPVHRYRDGYKGLEKLREIFFSKVSNTPDVERFIDFYRWFDSALNKLIKELVPVSARMPDNVQNVIESHILERNKYRAKFPTIEEKLNIIEGVAKGISEQMSVDDDDNVNIPLYKQSFARMSDNWSVSHAPISKSQKDNVLWWKTRTERSDPDLTSGDTSVDTSRQTIADVLQRTTDRKRQTALRTTFGHDKYIKGGVNFPTQKKYDLYKSGRANSTLQANVITRDGSSKLFIDRRINTVDYSELIQKEKLDVQIQDGAGDAAPTGDMAFPFSIYSSSVDVGYGVTDLHTLSTPESIKIDITGLHEDVYGPEYERPLQGPFTRTHVGGMPHRSNFVSDGTDTQDTRAEAFRVYADTTKLKIVNPRNNPFGNARYHLPRSDFYKDGTSRRPINIKNIQHTTASNFLGNYEKDYQIVQTSNRRLNNRWFVDTEGGDLESSDLDFAKDSFNLSTTADSGLVGGLKDYTKPIRARGKHVIVERFSAPGGPETMGDTDGGPGLDALSAEYSIYNCLNYRNFNVRQVLNDFASIHCGPGGHSSHEDDVASWYTSAPSASFRKIQRNGFRRIKYNAGFDTASDPGDGSAFSTASIYDNEFIQRPIPAQDSGYAWITASAVASSLPFGHALEEDEINFLSASELGSTVPYPNREFGITLAQSDAASATGFLRTDFAGLNYHIYEPITASSNILGYSSFDCPTNCIGGDFDDLSNYQNISTIKRNADWPSWVSYAGVLNALIHHRQGPYGWPSWKQIRGRNHPIRRDEVQHNRFSIVKTEERAHEGATFKFSKSTSLKQYTEPPITSKHKYISHEFAVAGAPEGLRYKVDHSYGNNKTRFTNRDLNLELFGSDNDERTQTYDQLYQDYSLNFRSPSERERLGNIPAGKSIFRNMIYREIVYPAEANTYLSGTRARTQFTYNHLWNSTRADRTKTNRINDFGETIPTESVWPLDARADFATAVPGYANKTDGAGALQASYVRWHSGSLLMPANEYKLKAGAVYARRTVSDAATASFPEIAGDTMWEAATQSGLEPYYTSYESYAEVMRAQGKEYSLIPEFRISEHLEYYIKDNLSDFSATRDSLFSLTGAASSDSSFSSFCREYLHSDFMKFFDVFRKDHESNNASAITLTCKAFKKFLPYEGFYPAQRALKVASLFSSSYANALTSSGADSDDERVTAPVRYRPIASALYAPGILFNSIKSGIAVDYPVHVSSELNPSASVGTSTIPEHVPQMSIAQNYDDRIPFEGLMFPEIYFPGPSGASLANQSIKIIDNEPHPSASLNLTASFNPSVQPDPLYSIAMNNFLAETMNFFLKKRGPGAIVSKPVNKISFDNQSFGRYAMEINLRQTKDFTMYNRASAFGPPSAVQFGVLSIPTNYSNTASVYWPHTPPYFGTEKGAQAIITFPAGDTVLENKEYTLMEIINSSSVTFRRSTPAHEEGFFSFAYVYTGPGAQRMQLDSSVNLFNIVKRKQISFSEAGGIQSISNDPSSGNPESQWVISPKFECPVLDFQSVSVTSGAYGSECLSRGMWHQYGSLPSVDKGIYLSVEDYKFATDHTMTGSLAKVLGFSSMEGETFRTAAQFVGGGAKIKIGDMPQKTREVFEAVVAVPFMLNNSNEKEFFTIPRDHIEYAKKKLKGATSELDFTGIPQEVIDDPPHRSIVNIVAMMDKYVFPPSFNFVEFEEVTPAVMFVFEFNYKFSGQDLANIWQNLLPATNKTRGPIPTGHSSHEESARIPDVSEISVVHPSLRTAFFDPTKKVGKELRWMVFKVKQRALNNYGDAVKLSTLTDYTPIPGMSLTKRLERLDLLNRVGASPMTNVNHAVTRGYSYNWPYDYFSFVELVNLEAEVALSSEPDEIPEGHEKSRIHEGINE